MKQNNSEYRVWNEQGQFIGDQPVASHIHAMARDVQPNSISKADINSMLKGRQ